MFDKKLIKCLAFLLATGICQCMAQGAIPCVTISQTDGNITAETPVKAVFSLERYNEMTGIIKQETFNCLISHKDDYSLPFDKKSYGVTFTNPDTGNEESVNLLNMRQGLSTWNLNAAAPDPSRIRNRVAMDILNSFALLPYPTSHEQRMGNVGQFVELWNGEQYEGIFCLCDIADNSLLGCKEPENGHVGGVIYKYGGGEWNGWTLEYPDKTAEDVWQPLASLMDTPWETVREHAYADTVRQHFYWDNLVDVYLLSLAVGLSHFGYENTILACPDYNADKRFVVVPRDMDYCFGHTAEGKDNDPTATIQGQSNLSKIDPFKRLIENPAHGFLTALANRWEQLSNGPLSVENVEKIIYEYASLLDDTGVWGNELERWNSNHTALYETAQVEADNMTAWYRTNHQQLTQLLARYLPTSVNTPNASPKPSDNKYYDLQGRPSLPTNGNASIYIHNNKKYVIK